MPFEKHVVSAHRTPHVDGRVRARRRGARSRGDHRRSRRRGSSARHDRRAHGAAGARRAGSERRAQWARFAPLDRADAGRRSGRDAGYRQGRRNQRGLTRRRDPGDLAARTCARSSAPFARSKPRRCGRIACREPRDPARVAPSGCSAADSSAACSLSPLGAMGYRVHTLSPAEDTPTGQVADMEITADYDDLDAIRRLCARASTS